jgi:hypothetical protein
MRRSPLVKFVFSMCRPRISSWISWLRACLYSYLLIFGLVYASVILLLRLWGFRYVYLGVYL